MIHFLKYVNTIKQNSNFKLLLQFMNDAGFSSITYEDYSLACSNKLSTNLAKLKVLKVYTYKIVS